jgi:hypothetical protein
MSDEALIANAPPEKAAANLRRHDLFVIEISPIKALTW